MTFEILPLKDNVRDAYARQTTQRHGDAGFDLSFQDKVVVPARACGKTIPLGIKAKAVIEDVDQPFMLFTRSSVSKTPLRLANPPGLIDPTYRGELKVALDNDDD